MGSGDAFGSGGRRQACILLSDGETSVLLDCGTTSLVGLKALGIDPNSIGAVFISHLHGDHFGGIPFLVLDGQFSRREAPLAVFGPPGTTKRLNETMEALFPGSTAVERKFAVEVTEMAAGADYEFAGIAARAYLADHASGASAHILRIEWQRRVIAYSGDTAWTPALAAASRGSALLICEAYFLDKKVPYHLSYGELLEHLAEVDAKRIVLTHMTGEMIAAADVELERAFDGMVIEL